MSNAKVQDLVILNGQTLSRWVDNDHEGLEADGFMLYTPAAAAGTFTIEVTHQRGTSPSIVTTLVIAGADAAPPAPGKAKYYPELAAVMQWRIKASVGVTGDQTFYATAYVDA